MTRKIVNAVLSLVAALVFFTGPLFAADTVTHTAALNRLDAGHEQILVRALESISRGEIEKAIESVSLIIDAYPNYRLAQLMYADLLMAKSYPIRDFGNFQSAPYEQIRSLLSEARTRWQYYQNPLPINKIPSSLVQLNESQQHAVVVDLRTSRLYVYKNRDGVPELIHDLYISIGKNGIGKDVEGDQKTPVGVYFVTGFIDPEKLPDLYGSGAFPIDYPNPWDRRNGRTGYGIWLHGTPSNTFSRPPLDSDGCVVLSNSELEMIAPYLREDTPFILTEDIEWLDQTEWQSRQSDYALLVDQWRNDWESRNPELYLDHYSPQYSGLGMDYEAWVEYKRRVNPSKDYIKVGISEKSIFQYPGEENMVIVTFRQEYRSDNLLRNTVKRQYWRMEQDGRWRIVYEGSAS
ncbi:MAG: L,D-transpeptidase family protein [Gammaproteobacteria bacterium]